MSKRFDATVSTECHSAVSVVNALATGKGSAIGIAIKCRLKAAIVSKESIPTYLQKSSVQVSSNSEDTHNIIVSCKRQTERFLKMEIPKDKASSFEIESRIPPAVGLKSSSAISIAAVQAIARLLSKELDQKSILKISCRASIESGASITGAYDDAAACLLGGMVLANNSKFRLLKHTRVPKLLGETVVIRVPVKRKRFTSSVNPEIYSNFKGESLKAFQYAKRGEVAASMLLNSIIQCSALGYSLEPVSSAIEEGASASGISGKGPAVFAFCQTRALANSIVRRWRKETDESLSIIKTQIVQPERLISC